MKRIALFIVLTLACGADTSRDGKVVSEVVVEPDTLDINGAATITFILENRTKDDVILDFGDACDFSTYALYLGDSLVYGEVLVCPAVPSRYVIGSGESRSQSFHFNPRGFKSGKRSYDSRPLNPGTYTVRAGVRDYTVYPEAEALITVVEAGLSN